MVDTDVMDRSGLALVGATTGVVTSLVAIGTGQLVAGLVDPQASPIVIVGGTAIDATPEWLKGWAIRTFGSSDKLVLLTGIAATLFLIAVVLGIASVRRLWVGLAGLAVLGLVGVVAALARPASRPIDVLPAIAGSLAGAFTLVKCHGTLGLSRMAPPGAEAVRGQGAPTPMPAGFDRRRFLAAAGWGVVAAVAAGGAGRFLARRFETAASRAGVRIPAPSEPLASPGAATDLSIPGLSPFVTPVDEFYRVDTALLVPSVAAEDWRLRIHGMVEREMTLSYRQLLSRPLIERDITLCCVSNEVGGNYIGNARWVGAPLKEILKEAGVSSESTQLVSRSVDGFTVGTPTEAAMDGRDAMLAVAMNGEALTPAHGFPVRMIVPGLYGYVSATKWVIEMELTTFEAFDAYWIERGWAEQAPIKTQSRIDTPRGGSSVRAGRVVPVAGVAWAPHVGIDKVEIRVDGGAWQEAQLSNEDTIDTWRQFVYRWEASPGSHVIQVRATDGTGALQTPERGEPFPNGATGYHEIYVQAS
jgi:DMSO/TMAO reductase YedYZ molybdopterin-dependent catalytic subunit